MAEPRLDPFDITARARASYGPDGRLGLPRMATWPIFPFVTDGLQTRTVEDPVLPEPPRNGESGEDDCWTCKQDDGDFLWTDDHWRLGMPAEPMALPTLVVHSRAHLDSADLTDELAAEMGVVTVRAYKALDGIPGVGRVHVNKWGDGGAHLHVILYARPEGMIQLKGMYLSTWIDVLPPLPVETWAAIRAHVAGELAARSGTA